MRLAVAAAIASRPSMLRFMNRTMASSGPGHQLRYASVDLSEVSDSGARSSTSTAPIPCRTARCQATAAPAIPAPQMTTSARCGMGRLLAGGGSEHVDFGRQIDAEALAHRSANILGQLQDLGTRRAAQID